MTVHSRVPRPILVVASVLALVGAACAGATTSPTASSAPSASAAAGSASPSAGASPTASAEGSPAASASGEVGGVVGLAITAQDYSFNQPKSVPAGTLRISLSNEGKEEHQAQFALLDPDTAFPELLAALHQPNPADAFALVTLVGGPNGVQPGETREVVTAVPPGRYALICFVNSPDGTTHLSKGMIAPLEVTGEEAATELPAGDAEVTAKDFAFESLSIPAGPQDVTLINEGPQPHEATVVKLAEGVTVESVQQIIASGEAPEGPPPWTDVGGITAIAPGTRAIMRLDLTAGDYALVCFVPDPATGTPHIQLGMIAPLTVE